MAPSVPEVPYASPTTTHPLLNTCRAVVIVHRKAVNSPRWMTHAEIQLKMNFILIRTLCTWQVILQNQKYILQFCLYDVAIT